MSFCLYENDIHNPFNHILLGRNMYKNSLKTIILKALSKLQFFYFYLNTLLILEIVYLSITKFKNFNNVKGY